MTEGRRTALLGILLVALPALALTANLPSRPQLLGVLNNAAHAPVFGALAIVVFSLLQRFQALVSWRSYAGAFVIAVVIGGIVELVQPAIGRGGEIGDLINDALGAIGGLGLLAFFRSRKRPAILIAVAAFAPVVWPVADAAVACVLRNSQFPTLLGGRAWPDRYFVHTRGVTVSRARLPSPWNRRDDPPSLLVEIVASRWPGVTHSEPYSDWRGYSRLMIDITNPDIRPLTLTLRVHDLAHDNEARDRFNLDLALDGLRRQTVVVPLDEVERAPAGRLMDLSRIAGIIIYGDGDPGSIGRRYYVTRIWLE